MLLITSLFVAINYGFRITPWCVARKNSFRCENLSNCNIYLKGVCSIWHNRSSKSSSNRPIRYFTRYPYKNLASLTDTIHHFDLGVDIPSGMGGTWGIYPYANNKLVYSSDMSNGLFVLNLTATPVPKPKGKFKVIFLQIQKSDQNVFQMLQH